MIDLSVETSQDPFPGALAYSQPFEGTHIHVFYDRLRQTYCRCPPSALLAHVLAHEIGHILEGTNSHSRSGIMKAHWDDNDLSKIARQQLPFAPEGVFLIHRGLRIRAALSQSKGIRHGC